MFVEIILDAPHLLEEMLLRFFGPTRYTTVSPRIFSKENLSQQKNFHASLCYHK